MRLFASYCTNMCCLRKRLGEAFVKRIQPDGMSGKEGGTGKEGSFGREEVAVYCPFTEDKSSRNMIY